MRRDISSSLGQGPCDAGGTEEQREEILLSIFDAVFGKGS
jgi:hypothetical protein